MIDRIGKQAMTSTSTARMMKARWRLVCAGGDVVAIIPKAWE